MKKPIVIFVHGFKGFKDWGAFNHIARMFASKGLIYLKFNFSYNGTTPQEPEQFVDLEAFGDNTFSIELNDLGKVIDWVLDTPLVSENQKNKSEIYLVGHSRGGGIAILKANEDNRIAKVVTWSSVNDFGAFWTPERIREWKKNGVIHTENGRTRQIMPLKLSLLEDYENNVLRLNIKEAVKQLKIPLMAIHGTEDEAVPFEHSIEMKRLNPGIKLDLIPNGSHTFGGRHPFTDQMLPFDLQTVVEHTIDFLKS